ncbi:MAG TPA: hypothetical protein VF462_11095 [Micromonosporaceae bacterium]
MSGSRSFPSPSELARPGKRARVAADLTGFHGPTSGRVELPHRMFWQANRVFDLDKPFMLQWMYEIVLREAMTIDELRAWLDVPTLHRLWPALYLPHGVRRDWEQHHPSLREARLASAEQANPTYERWLARQATK